ncbi:MAG: hypothetical protein GY810_25935, partial [Aureispira sp.]|nr:hypothetical protein [Aureispira sp.]
MKLSCIKCNPEGFFEVPEFSMETKEKLWGVRVDSGLKAVKEIMETHKQAHRDAKFIVAHLNPKQGECHQCKTELLDKEYISCPNCKALNLNWNLFKGNNIK